MLPFFCWKCFVFPKTILLIIPIDWFFVKSSTPPTSIILRLNCHRKGVKYHYDINFNFKRLAQEKFIRVDLTIMSPPVYRRYFFVLDVCLSVCPLIRLSVQNRFRSISPKQVVGFSWNLCQMFAMEAMCRTHVPTIPVQGQGQACRSNGRFGRLLYWHPNTLLLVLILIILIIFLSPVFVRPFSRRWMEGLFWNFT